MRTFLIYFIIVLIGTTCEMLWGGDTASYAIGLITGSLLMMVLEEKYYRRNKYGSDENES